MNRHNRMRTFVPVLLIVLIALASLACGVGTPATAIPPVIASEQGNIEVMVQALKQAQEEGGENNAVIFTADPERNYYIQFAAAKGQSELYGEAVSNQYIPESYALDDNQKALLETMGWSLQAGGNYLRQFEAGNDDERLAVAKEVMRAFVEVYGVAADSPVQPDLMLQ